MTESLDITRRSQNQLLWIIVFVIISFLAYIFFQLEDTHTALEIETALHDERKASEQKYKTLSEELHEANELKELFLDIVSHDLKTLQVSF